MRSDEYLFLQQLNCQYLNREGQHVEALHTTQCCLSLTPPLTYRIVLTVIFPGKRSLASFSLEIRGFDAKFYGPDAFYDAGQQNYTLGFTLYASSTTAEGEGIRYTMLKCTFVNNQKVVEL